MRYWHTTTFWAKVQHTVALFGTGGQVAIVATNSLPIWNYIAGGATVATLIFSIWMDDKDDDGIVDVFQKEIVIKAKIKTSVAPAKTDVEVTETIIPQKENEN